MTQFYSPPGIGYTRKTECEINGEHWGDTYTKDDDLGRWEHWTCCDAVKFLGELFDCDTCLEPGLCTNSDPMPPGWVEDTNGYHCGKCQ